MNIQLYHLSTFLCSINHPVGFRLQDREALKLYPEETVGKAYGWKEEEERFFLHGSDERAYEC